MDIYVDFNDLIEQELRKEIDFIKNEVYYLFGNKDYFSDEDKKLATNLLKYLTRLIKTPICIDFLTEALENLEIQFPTLFY